MAETLACGTATAVAVAMTTSATLNDWRPDDTFFDLLGGKDVVQAMLADIASPTASLVLFICGMVAIRTAITTVN